MGIGVGSIDEFRKVHRGTVITRDDPGYDDARAIWNAPGAVRLTPGRVCSAGGQRCAGRRYARAMGTDPTRKLVVPRVAATILVMPLLVAMADLIGLFGGFLTAFFTLRIGGIEFWTRAVNALELSDIAQGMSKPLVFGFIVATVGCYQGLSVRGGTQGVGRATTQAVVVASVLILISNFFLTRVALFLAGKV